MALLAALSCTGCAALIPTTTRQVPHVPILASTDRATIVLARQFQKPVGPYVLYPCAAYDPERQQAADAPLYESANYVRIVDERGEVLADLRYAEHAAVSIPAGSHMLVAYNWSTAPGMTHGPDRVPAFVADEALWRRNLAGTVAMLHGMFAGGHIYPVRIIETVSRGSCTSLELMKVQPRDLAPFEVWLASSDRVDTLGRARQRSTLLDEPDLVATLLTWARWRMTNDPRWEASSSTVGTADGIDRIDAR